MGRLRHHSSYIAPAAVRHSLLFVPQKERLVVRAAVESYDYSVSVFADQLSLSVSPAMGGDGTDIYRDDEKTNRQTETAVQEDGDSSIDRGMHHRIGTDDMGNDL